MSRIICSTCNILSISLLQSFGDCKYMQHYAAKVFILFPFYSTLQPMVGSLFSLGNECQTENTETWHFLCCDASFEWVNLKLPRPKDSYLREKFAKAKSKGKAKVKAPTKGCALSDAASYIFLQSSCVLCLHVHLHCPERELFSWIMAGRDWTMLNLQKGPL